MSGGEPENETLLLKLVFFVKVTDAAACLGPEGIWNFGFGPGRTLTGSFAGPGLPRTGPSGTFLPLSSLRSSWIGTWKGLNLPDLCGRADPCFSARLPEADVDACAPAICRAATIATAAVPRTAAPTTRLRPLPRPRFPDGCPRSTAADMAPPSFARNAQPQDGRTDCLRRHDPRCASAGRQRGREL